METVIGIVVGVLVLGLIAWAQVGALFTRTYRRDDPGASSKEADSGT